MRRWSACSPGPPGRGLGEGVGRPSRDGHDERSSASGVLCRIVSGAARGGRGNPAQASCFGVVLEQQSRTVHRFTWRAVEESSIYPRRRSSPLAGLESAAYRLTEPGSLPFCDKGPWRRESRSSLKLTVSSCSNHEVARLEALLRSTTGLPVMAAEPTSSLSLGRRSWFLPADSGQTRIAVCVVVGRVAVPRGAGAHREALGYTDAVRAGPAVARARRPASSRRPPSA